MAKSGRQLDREIAEALQRKHSEKTTTRTRKKRAHSTKLAASDIDELIASDDLADWDVARDYAIKKNKKDLIVRLDMARALNVKPSDFDDVVKGQPFDKSYEVQLGNKAYVVADDEDAAYKMAVEYVTDSLKDDPTTMFNQVFLEQHLDEKKLRKVVYDSRMEDDYVEELAEHQPDDFWELAARLDVHAAVPDTDEDGERLEPTQKQINAVKKAYAKETADHPMEFFRDIYGEDEAFKHAIKAAGIDIKAAAEDAVDTDGWQHHLAHYDGNSYTTDEGFVYWRTN